MRCVINLQMQVRRLKPQPSTTRTNCRVSVSRPPLSVVGIVVARYIIVVVALATAISLLAQQISSIRLPNLIDGKKVGAAEVALAACQIAPWLLSSSLLR